MPPRSKLGGPAARRAGGLVGRRRGSVVEIAVDRVRDLCLPAVSTYVRSILA